MFYEDPLFHRVLLWSNSYINVSFFAQFPSAVYLQHCSRHRIGLGKHPLSSFPFVTNSRVVQMGRGKLKAKLCLGTAHKQGMPFNPTSHEGNEYAKQPSCTCNQQNIIYEIPSVLLFREVVFTEVAIFGMSILLIAAGRDSFMQSVINFSTCQLGPRLPFSQN